MRYIGMILAALLPYTAYADPLDRGEAYTTRQGPPDWMNGVDLTWLIVDYGLFAVVIIALGWVLMRRPHLFAGFESALKAPFAALLAGAVHLPVILRELAQGIVGLMVLALIVAWVLLCQWLSHIGMGGLSMAGLALEAVILVRLIRGGEREQRI